MSEIALSVAVNLALGIALFLLLYGTRRNGGMRLAGPPEAMALFASHFPDAAGEAMVTVDHQNALIELPPGTEVGLVQLQGRRWNARKIAPGDIRTVHLGSDGAIRIKFADFGWPGATLCFADPDHRLRWLQRLAVLQRHSLAQSPAAVRRA